MAVNRKAELRRNLGLMRTDHIAGTTHGLQQWGGEAFVQLAAQARNMHVNHVGLRIKVIVPDIFKQHCASNNMPSVADEIFQQFEFTRLQYNWRSTTRYCAGEEIQLKIKDP